MDETRLSAELRASLTRRRLMRRSAELGLAATIPAWLAACGGDDSSSSSSGSSTGTTTAAAEIAGTIKLRTYPGWIGDKEIAMFREKFPKANVKEVADTSSGVAETVALLARSKGDFDLSLGGLDSGGQLKEAGLLADPDVSKLPNLKNMPPEIVEAFPIGVPGDYGKTGFAYRKDLISERPTTWAEFWKLAEKYSGKVTTFKYDVDVMGAALIYKGFDINTKSQDELTQAKDALLELKPHFRALLDTDFTKPLLKGEASLAIAYDYDVAAASDKDPNIVWVAPEEGTPAYLEGWFALKDSTKLETTWAFMNHHLEPKVYGNYINTIGAAYLMPKAEPYIKSAIKDNPSLAFDEETIKRVKFEKYNGKEVAAIRAKLWSEFLSA